MNREQLNAIERTLIDVRPRITKLPDIARFQSFINVYAHVLYLRDKFGLLAIELYRIENQGVLPIDETTPNQDRV